MKRLIVVLAGLVVLGVAALGWWALSPLLYDREVNEVLDPEVQVILEAETSNGAKTESSRGGTFPIIGTTGHPASGQLKVIQTSEERLIHYQNYDGTNGPDLYVYLAKDLEANDFISLGKQKGNKGNIIYEIPTDIDLTEYKYVLTWCKAFGVLFDYVEIN